MFLPPLASFDSAMVEHGDSRERTVGSSRCLRVARDTRRRKRRRGV